MTTSDDPSRIGGHVGALVVLASVGDTEGTRTITSIVALLAVLGIGLVMIAVWLFKVTRPDRELLAPLEVMGERKWRRADPVWQRRRLDEVRPPDAEPLQPSAAPPDFDEAFDKGPTASGFDDLHEDVSHRVVGQPVVAQREARDVPGNDAAEGADDDMSEATGDAGADDGAPANGAPIGPAPTDAARADAAAPVAAPAAGAAASAATNLDANGGTPHPSPPVPRPVSPTPLGIQRPLELPEREIDPDVLAAAIAELDAELGLGGERDRRPAE